MERPLGHSPSFHPPGPRRIKERTIGAFRWDAHVIRWGLKFTFLGVLLAAALIWLSRPTQPTSPSHEGQTLNTLIVARTSN